MQISPSVMSSGLSSLQSGQRRVEQAATEIAGAALPPAQRAPGMAPPQSAPTAPDERSASTDLASSLVELNVGKVQAQAGAKLIETADDVLGTLIDTRA
ncbi:MAG: hypothetical protein ABWY06_03840 [Pseudomonas sp.]|uniref:hypothetical protein n=1 Tax=Pseudomonas sp. TaxID=306 RepID=UPI0033969E16